MEATKRSQFLYYDLIRSGQIACNEHAVLNIIYSFSERCEVTQQYIAEAINKSVSTVRRSIKSLIAKGIITRRYTVFKRCVLKLVSLEAQKALMTASGILKQAIKTAKTMTKKLIKSTDRSPVVELNRSSVNEPTRSKTLEIKHTKIDIKPKAFDLEKTKAEALLRYKAHLLS